MNQGIEECEHEQDSQDNMTQNTGNEIRNNDITSDTNSTIRIETSEDKQTSRITQQDRNEDGNSEQGQENRTKKKCRRKKKIVVGVEGDSSNTIEEEEIVVRTPNDLIRKLTNRDKNLKYIEEHIGLKVTYLDLDLEVRGKELRINIYRKPAHQWDLPEWGSRATYRHKRAAIMPLLIRANRVLSIDRKSVV